MSGDEYEEVVNRCWGETLRVVNRKVSPREDAEDVVIDVFMKLWKYKDEIDPDKVIHWLNRVTRTTVVDYHRGRKIDHEPLYKANDKVDQDRFSSPLYFVLVEDDMRRVSGIMESHMTDSQSQVLHLSYGQGKTPTEIGVIMSTSAGAVSQQKRRSLAKLTALFFGE